MTFQTLIFRMVVVAALTALALYGSAYADYSDREDVRAYVAELHREHGFDEAQLLALFSSASRKESIREAMSRPAEKTLKWHEYRQIFLQEPRISQGLEFWAANAAELERARQKYGVPPEYVVAILGVETRYGRTVGNYRVLDALATLAFDYPAAAGSSRADFFRRELTEFLLLAREEGKDPLELKGSYAGAMGYGQFIPSSYRAYAVDFDGDGHRDIWQSETDAIGSVANYFNVHGWRAGEQTVVPVAPGSQARIAEIDALANSSLEPETAVATLAELGLQVGDLDPDMQVALFRMELTDGAEYWVGLQNFYVITRYNRSRLYSLAVHQLAQMILTEHNVQLAAAQTAE